jgi:hypothetical protein
MKSNIRFSKKDKKLLAWINILKENNSGDISYIISKTIEFYAITGRYLEIARLSSSSFEHITKQAIDITIYIPENSFFAQFHKNHSTNFQKEVRKILNNSISYIENSDENLFITREILENAFQRINSFSPVSMDMLKSKTAPAHDNPTKAGDLSSLTDSFKSGDNSLVVENTDKSFSNNAASKQFIAVEEEDIKFDSSKESSSSQKKDESNNQEYTAEQVEEFLKGLGSLSP